MRKMNRCFASTISFFMLAGLLPTNVQADLKDNTMLTAVELEGTSLLDELEGNINEVKGQALYGDDEFVTAIVELEEAPVMDYYDSSSYFSLDEENSAGESVSKFLASDDIKEVSEELLDNQKNIISEIMRELMWLQYQKKQLKLLIIGQLSLMLYLSVYHTEC